MKKDMIISQGKQYWLRSADGSRRQITSKEAWNIFSGWKAAGLKIRRKYGMGGKVTWVWAE